MCARTIPYRSTPTLSRFLRMMPKNPVHQPAPAMKSFFASILIDSTNSHEEIMVQVHLDALTILDRARPDDSPSRNILHSTPDETTQGGLHYLVGLPLGRAQSSTGVDRRHRPQRVGYGGRRTVQHSAGQDRKERRARASCCCMR